MTQVKELLSITGYVRGGCSFIGMKKQLPIVIHESALNFETIIFSAGKISLQVEVSIKDLKDVIPFTIGNIFE